MTRAGLIVNPLSGKTSGKGLALAELLRNTPTVSVQVIEDFRKLPFYLEQFAKAEVTDLFISSGDGTIHAIQTLLAEQSFFPHPPRLGLLPHGTTNMTAADLGFRSRSIRRQADFMQRLEPTVVKRRPTLRVANPRDGKPRHGMFLGTGAVSEATALCQRVFNARGVKGSWATFATLASTTARIAFTKADPHDETRLDRPYPLQVENDGFVYATGNQLMLLATTLEKLILGTKPFWGGGMGPIRASIFPYPVPNLLRWLPLVMYGGENRPTPPGAISFSGERFQISSQSNYVIDGEFFDGPLHAPLQVESGTMFTYLCR